MISDESPVIDDDDPVTDDSLPVTDNDEETDDFEDYCDDDGNGVINKWEFDLDFGVVENAERNTIYISEEKTVRVNPATTAVAKTTLGTIVINGTDTGLSESPINDGDKLSIKGIVSSNEFETTVTANITVEFEVNEGNIDDWTVSGNYSINTGICDSGDERTLENYCGLDNRGSRPQLCLSSQWEYNGECDDPDICIDGNFQNGETICGVLDVGFFEQLCISGHWEDTEKCICDDEVFPHYHKGLCWSDNAPDTMEWSNAISYCEGLSGRLPNIQEYRSLIKECPQTEYPKPYGQDPWCEIEDPDKLAGEYFISASCDGCLVDSFGKYSVFGDKDGYLSSSSYLGDANVVWGVHFNIGRVGSAPKATAYSVRCVR